MHPQCLQTSVSTVANNGQVVAVSFPVFSKLSLNPHRRCPVNKKLILFGLGY